MFNITKKKSPPQMIKIGLREANLRFKPVSRKKETEEERLVYLEDQGLLKRSVKGKSPLPKSVTLNGKPLSKIVSEEREKAIFGIWQSD